MNLRLVDDRGFVSAEVSAPITPDDWIPLSLLLQVMLQRSPLQEPSLGQQADFVRQHFAEIAARLSPEQLARTVQEVHQMGMARYKIRFPGSVIE